MPTLNPGTFNQGTEALGDFVLTNNASWSSGAYRLLRLDAQPTLARPWTVYGWGIQFKGFFFAPAGSSQAYGKLGTVLASLIIGGSLVSASSGTFQPPAQNALPNLVTVWDGASDPPFPFLASNTSAAPIGGSVQTIQQLPQPTPLSAGDQLAIGLWMTPMLVGGQLQLFLYNLTYTVNYE